MANPVKELDHPEQTIREVRLFIRQYIWPDGVSSYDAPSPYDYSDEDEEA